MQQLLRAVLTDPVTSNTGSNTAIIVALIGAVGFVIASALGVIWRRRQPDDDELKASRIYADLKRERDVADKLGARLRKSEQDRFEIRDELERVTERLHTAERKAERAEERAGRLATALRENGIPMP